MAGPSSRKPLTREDALRDFRTDQILEAAREVIARLGYGEASIDRIAEAAGVARSTVYVYFEGKDDLLNQCLAQHRVELSERVHRAVDPEESIEGRLQAFLEAIFGYVGEYGAFFRAMMQVRGLDPFFQEAVAPAPEIHAIRTESQAVLADILKDASTHGRLRGVGVDEAGRLIGAMLYGVLMRRANDAAPERADAEAALVVRALLDGILARAD